MDFAQREQYTPSTTPSKRKPRIASFVEQKDWEHENCHHELLEILFRINERNSSFQLEVYAGVIQFISCWAFLILFAVDICLGMYFLPVIPQKMAAAGYDVDTTFAVAVKRFYAHKLLKDSFG